MSHTDVLQFLPALAVALADSWCACGDCFALLAIEWAGRVMMRRERWGRA